MRVICDRGALLDALNLAGGAILARTPKPVLSCVRITAEADALTVAATDLEMAVTVSTPRVEVQEAGQALVPADKLAQIVRESIDPTLTIETDEEAAHIRSADSHFKVFGFKPEEFPPLPQLEADADFEIDGAQLHKLITQTKFATARESSRYAINGVLFERDGKKLTVVATDGRRLAMAKGDCKQAKGDNRSAIVPTKTLDLLLRVFDQPDQNVRVRIADNQIMFASDNALVSSNLVEGNFPPYQDVLPQDNDRKATMATDMLASAVRRAAVLTNEESKGVRLSFTGEQLTLSSRAPEMGEAEIQVEMPEYSGEPVDIGFNPGFITDALKVAETDKVSVEMKASNKPGVIRTGPDFLCVIMPVNLE